MTTPLSGKIFFISRVGLAMENICRILVRTIPCLSPKLAYENSVLIPFAKTVCVSVRKNSVDGIER